MKILKTLCPIAAAAAVAASAEPNPARQLTVAVVDSCCTNDLVAVSRGTFDELTVAGRLPFVIPALKKRESISALLAKCDLVLMPNSADEFAAVVREEAEKIGRPLFGEVNDIPADLSNAGNTVTSSVPVIGIADYCAFEPVVCAKRSMIEALELAGFAPMIMPELDDAANARLLALTDGLMIGGGIGKRQDYKRRCAYEIRLIKAAVPLGRPIVGICHGSQIINLAFDGTIGFTPTPQSVVHKKPAPGSLNKCLHSVTNEPDSLVAKVMGETCTVNSSHTKRSIEMGKGLRVTSRAADGVIEAFEHESLPVRAFQFHPECLYKIDPRALDLLKAAFEVRQ